MKTEQHKGVIFFDRAMAGSFYALAFFIPISNALVETFTVTALLSYIIKRSIIFSLKWQGERDQEVSGVLICFWRTFAHSFRPPTNPLNTPIAVWLGVCLFSVVVSQRPSLSFEGFLGKYLQNAFIFFNFVEAIRTKKRLRLLLSSLFVSMFFVCLSGINQYVFRMDFIRLNAIEQNRLSSSLRAPNDFAAYLVMTIPIVLSLVFSFKQMKENGRAFQILNRKDVQIFLFVLLAMGLACLGLSYSRGGWLAFCLSLTFFVLLNWKLFLALATAAGAFVLFFVFRMAKEREFINFTNLFSGFGRRIYWREALSMIKDRPFVGFGVNTYSIMARDYRIGWGGYPHNCYLQLTAEMGIMGLVSFLWIIFTLYQRAFRYIKQCGENQWKHLFVGIMAGFSGFLIHSAFDTFFYSVQLGALMWMVMGLLIAVPRIKS